MDSDTKNALENYYKLKGEYESKIQAQRKKLEMIEHYQNKKNEERCDSYLSV